METIEISLFKTEQGWTGKIKVNFGECPMKAFMMPNSIKSLLETIQLEITGLLNGQEPEDEIA